MVDPMKVEEIVQLSPPRTIHHIQILQGKANFLQGFVANYAEITKGFMRLLKKGVPFCWDQAAQHSSEALKHAFFLYLVVTESIIGMVLVQEDEAL